MKRLILAVLSTFALFGVANPELLANRDIPDDVQRTTTIEFRLNLG